MIGPEGLKVREKMIRGMFTPQTPPALQEQILKMMLSAPEATANGAMASVFRSVSEKGRRVDGPCACDLRRHSQVTDPNQTKEILPNNSSDATQARDTS